MRVAESEYDGGGVGDSFLTAVTAYPGHGRAARRAEYASDWRGRLVAVRQPSDSASTNAPLSFFTYDNLGQVLSAAVYDGDTASVGLTAPSVGLRRAYTQYAYDNLGRVYQTDVYGVNQSSGGLAPAPLTSRTWYDARGLVAKSETPDGRGSAGWGSVGMGMGPGQVRVVKAVYDGLGRATATYQTDGGGDTTYADALTLTGDTVWVQAEMEYDVDSNLLKTTTRQRWDGETGTGPLGTPTTGVKARVSFAGYYYDLFDRPTDAADVGTNGNVPWTRPASAPARSDTVLVSGVTYDDLGRVRDATDPRGIVTRTATDALGRPTAVTAAQGTADAAVVLYDYDSAGRLSAVVAPGSRGTAYGYDAWGRAATVTERGGTALARVSTVALDDLGGVLTATDPLGTVTAFTENALGRAVSVTAASGTALARTASGTFDVFGRPLTSTDPRGYTTSTSYDDVVRRAWTTDALGNTSGVGFDEAGRVIGAINANGEFAGVVYDPLGRATSTFDSLLAITTARYLVNGTTDETTDPLAHTTVTAYDRFARVASVTDPLNNITTFGYDRNSNTTSVTNAKGVTAAFAYDALDRVTGVTEAVGLSEQRTTSYTFSAAGDLASVTDPLGRPTTFAYDAAGRMTSQTAAAGTADAFTVGIAYDTLDRVVSVTRPGSRTTAYAYDALGQLTKATEGVGTALARDTTFGYDAGGNRTSVTDPLGFTTLTAYDKLGRVSGVTDATGGLVQVAYDKAGRTSSVTDPLGNVTSWGYDAAGRRTSETNPRGKTTAYAYDAADRLVGVTDRIGRVREFGYDAADRMTSEVWKTGGATVQTQTFGYDAVGNQTSATDPDGSSTLTYDNLNRVVGVSGPWGVTQAFGYDAADNRTSTSDNKGGGSTSTFDNLNRLTSRTQSASGMGTVRADWSYTAAGDVGTVTRYTDSAGTVLAGTTTNTHDALGRLVGIDHKNAAGASVGTYAYTFDAGDRLTGETFNGAGKTYAYDKLGQLTSDNGSGVSYDAAGNRNGSGYVTGTGNRTTSDGTWTYTYDDAGQLTGKSKSGEAWAYSYDHTGRMTGASKSASVGGAVTDAVTYKLDAWGNRIERGQTGGTTSTQRYVVDGWDTAKPAALGTEGFEAVMDLDGGNGVTSRRVFGAGFDEAVARQDAGGAVTWYGADGQGTVRQVFDNSGAVSGSRAFTGFGAVTATSGTGLDRYAYTGTVTDPLTGLVGDDARQYDPQLGKWTSDDPIGFGGGDYNVSRAVGNAATTGRDPSGLFFFVHHADADKFEKDFLSGMRTIRDYAWHWELGRGYFLWVHPDARNQFEANLGGADNPFAQAIIRAVYEGSRGLSSTPEEGYFNVKGERKKGVWSIQENTPWGGFREAHKFYKESAEKSRPEARAQPDIGFARANGWSKDDIAAYTAARSYCTTDHEKFQLFTDFQPKDGPGFADKTGGYGSLMATQDVWRYSPQQMALHKLGVSQVLADLDPLTSFQMCAVYASHPDFNGPNGGGLRKEFANSAVKCYFTLATAAIGAGEGTAAMASAKNAYFRPGLTPNVSSLSTGQFRNFECWGGEFATDVVNGPSRLGPVSVTSQLPSQPAYTVTSPVPVLPPLTITQAPRFVEVDPSTLRWSQRKAGTGGRADPMRKSMATNGWAGTPIDVVQTVDGLATVDHTRASVALEQGIRRIPAWVFLPEEQLPSTMLLRPWDGKGTTATTWGEALQIRGAGQKPPIGPTGTLTPPKLPKPKN